MICQQRLNIYTASFLTKRSISNIYKTELVEQIAAQTEIPKTTATKALKALIDSVVATVARGDTSYFLALVLSSLPSVPLAPANTRRRVQR